MTAGEGVRVSSVTMGTVPFVILMTASPVAWRPLRWAVAKRISEPAVFPGVKVSAGTVEGEIVPRAVLLSAQE